MAQKYTLSHKNFTKIQCFKRTLKGIFPHDTLSHNFLINCNTLSHNFYQKKTTCRIIFTVKGHPVEQNIPSSQVWEYPRPPTGLHCTASRIAEFRKQKQTLERTSGLCTLSKPFRNPTANVMCLLLTLYELVLCYSINAWLEQASLLHARMISTS